MEFSTYSLIWFNGQSNFFELNQLAQERIRSLVDLRRIFEHVDRCVENIRQSTDEQIILVLHGETAETIVSNIHDLPQVIAIYMSTISMRTNTNNFLLIIPRYGSKTMNSEQTFFSSSENLNDLFDSLFDRSKV